MRSLIQFWAGSLTVASTISLMASGEIRSMKWQCNWAILRASKMLWQSLSSLHLEIPSLVRVQAGSACVEWEQRSFRRLVNFLAEILVFSFALLLNHFHLYCILFLSFSVFEKLSLALELERKVMLAGCFSQLSFFVTKRFDSNNNISRCGMQRSAVSLQFQLLICLLSSCCSM